MHNYAYLLGIQQSSLVPRWPSVSKVGSTFIQSRIYYSSVCSGTAGQSVFILRPPCTGGVDQRPHGHDWKERAAKTLLVQ